MVSHSARTGKELWGGVNVTSSESYVNQAIVDKRVALPSYFQIDIFQRDQLDIRLCKHNPRFCTSLDNSQFRNCGTVSPKHKCNLRQKTYLLWCGSAGPYRTVPYPTGDAASLRWTKVYMRRHLLWYLENETVVWEGSSSLLGEAARDVGSSGPYVFILYQDLITFWGIDLGGKSYLEVLVHEL